MTVLLCILGILGALGLLIAWTPVGILVEKRGEELTIDVRVGPFHLRVFPGKPKPEKAGPPEPQPKSDKKAKKTKLSMSEIKTLLRTMWPPLRKALARTRKGVRIDCFQLWLTVGGEEDPAASAQLYGELHGAVWTVMPALEQVLVIRQPYIHIGIDFNQSEMDVQGKFSLFLRIGTLLWILMGLAVPGITWYLGFRKRNNAPAAAAAN